MEFIKTELVYIVIGIILLACVFVFTMHYSNYDNTRVPSTAVWITVNDNGTCYRAIKTEVHAGSVVSLGKVIECP